MKYWKGIVFLVVFGVVGWGLVSLYSSRNEAVQKAATLKGNLDKVQSENQALASQLEYFQKPENLLKELKEQTTYKNPGEKVIIVVPGVTSTTSTTSAKSP